MTLTAKLTTAMVLLAISTAGVVGMLTYRNLEEAIVPVELSRLHGEVQRHGGRLAEVYSLAQKDVIAFATGAAALGGIIRAHVNGGRDPEDGTTEQSWKARMARRFVADLEAKRGYDQFRIIGVENGGREMVRVDRSGPNGTVRIVPEEELQAKGDRDYFIETLKLPAGAIYFSKIDLNQERGKIEVPHRPMLRAATPIYTPDGKPFGILIINVDLRNTFAFLGVLENAGSSIFLVDRDGYYLHHPQEARTFGYVDGRNDRLQTDFPELAGLLGSMESKTGLMHAPNGETFGLAMLPLDLGGGRWMALVELIPEATLIAPLALVRNTSLVAGGLVALLAAGLALGLARSLTRPLVKLTRTVESFSLGQSRPVVTTATGEIGVLARAFATMQEEVNEKTKALHHSERRFRALIEHSGDGIALIDANNKILYVSPSVAAIEGYAPEELIGRNGTENTHPDDLPLLRSAVEQLVAHPGTPITVLWRRKHKNGQWLWLEGVAINLLGDPAVGAIVTNYRDVTERRKIEAALRESEELFSKAFRLSPDCVALVRLADRRAIMVNDAFCRLWGRTAEEIVGRSMTEFSSWSDEEARVAFMKTLQEKGEYLDHETTVRLKDGRSLDFNFSSRVLTLNGESCVLSVMRDITERKKAAVALRESEARYRTLFAYAPDGIVIADQSSYYLDANVSMCRMLGYTREELIGLHATNIVAPAEAKHINPALERLKSGSDHNREWQFRRKDGSTFAAEVIATLMPDGNLMAMIRDITERKNTEKALRESEEHFRFLNDLAESTRTLADPEQIMAVMLRMLGEHLGASRCAYADVEKDGENFTILRDYTNNCASTKGRYQLSLFGPRAVSTLRNGQTLIIRDVDKELSAAEGAGMFNHIGIKAIITCPLVKEGVFCAMMAVHQTAPRIWQPREIMIVQEVVERCWATIERRAAEEKISRLNAELERRVVERTAQLEAANKELEAFSYSVSHDLRSPLRAIDGFSLALVEDCETQLTDEGRRYLRTIREGAQQMGKLIDDLLAFAKLSRQELRREPVDTSALVRHTLMDLGSPWSDRQVDVKIGDLTKSLGDPTLLKQVWTNLLSNALKYTRKRKCALVEIGCTQVDGANTYFVRDNGTGFDMQYAHKLFGVFQRLHRAEDYEGTGVGLAIVQRVIHRHGGRVWAQSEVNAGTTFYFTLEENPNYERNQRS